MHSRLPAPFTLSFNKRVYTCMPRQYIYIYVRRASHPVSFFLSFFVPGRTPARHTPPPPSPLSLSCSLCLFFFFFFFFFFGSFVFCYRCRHILLKSTGYVSFFFFFFICCCTGTLSDGCCSGERDRHQRIPPEDHIIIIIILIDSIIETIEKNHWNHAILENHCSRINRQSHER